MQVSLLVQVYISSLIYTKFFKQLHLVLEKVIEVLRTPQATQLWVLITNSKN